MIEHFRQESKRLEAAGAYKAPAAQLIYSQSFHTSGQYRRWLTADSWTMVDV
jgi:hypothetical protein